MNRYENLRDVVIDDPETKKSWDEYEQDRSSGINRQPESSVRDGLNHRERMHPDHYIPNRRC